MRRLGFLAIIGLTQTRTGRCLRPTTCPKLLLKQELVFATLPEAWQIALSGEKLMKRLEGFRETRRDLSPGVPKLDIAQTEVVAITIQTDSRGRWPLERCSGTWTIEAEIGYSPPMAQKFAYTMIGAGRPIRLTSRCFAISTSPFTMGQR